MVLSKYDEVARLFSHSGILTPEYFKYLNNNVIPFYTKWFNSDELIALSNHKIFKECNPQMYPSDIEEFLTLISKRYVVNNVTSDNFAESISDILNDKDFQKILCCSALFNDPSTGSEIFNIKSISSFVLYFLSRLCMFNVSINHINSILKTVLPIRISLYWISQLNLVLNPKIVFNPEFSEFMNDVEKMKGFTILDMLVGLKMILDDKSHIVRVYKRSYSLAIFIGWLYFNIESRLDDSDIDDRSNILRKIINY